MVQGPLLWLALATLLMLLVAADARLERHRPLWMRLLINAVAFGALTWMLMRAVGSPFAPMPHTDARGEEIWAQLVEIGWWFLAARVAVSIVRILVILENRPRETQIVSDLLAGAIYITTGLAVVDIVFAVPIGGLLATSGVVAIILGLALQSTLADVFSGVAVGLERPYKPGDLLWVEGGIEGQVLEVNWRSTHIATFQSSVAIVPNSVIAKSRLENRSAPTPTRSVTVAITTDPAVDPERCIRVLEAAALASRFALAEPKATVTCNGLKGDGTSYEIRFIVGTSRDIPAARTDMLAKVHRHLRYAGIALGVSGVVSLPATTPPTLEQIMAESDALGQLGADERHALADHCMSVTINPGETLLREGEMAEAVYLLSGGTVEVLHGAGSDRHLLGRMSPGESLGMIGLITGTPSMVTATALTRVSAYRLDKAGFSAVLRTRPALAASLEKQAHRGQEWLRCEVASHQQEQMVKPDLLIARLRQFLVRLND